MPNPPKPIEQKRRTGNPGGRRLPAKTSTVALPAVSDRATAAGPVEAFDSIIEFARGWLANTDTVALALLRQSLEERDSLRALVMETQSPDHRRQLRLLDKQIVSQLSALGFDPTARSRLGLAEVKAASKLDELRQRRQERAQG